MHTRRHTNTNLRHQVITNRPRESKAKRWKPRQKTIQEDITSSYLQILK